MPAFQAGDVGSIPISRSIDDQGFRIPQRVKPICSPGRSRGGAIGHEEEVEPDQEEQTYSILARRLEQILPARGEVPEKEHAAHHRCPYVLSGVNPAHHDFITADRGATLYVPSPRTTPTARSSISMSKSRYGS